MAVFCSSLTSWFPGTLLTYFVSDFEMVSVAPIVTGITLVFTFQLLLLLLLVLLLLLLYIRIQQTAIYEPSKSLSLSVFQRQINPLKTKLRLLYLKTQSVPHCKHFSSRL